MIAPAEFYGLLSDQTRLRCLLLLFSEGELCVCELSNCLESSQPKISRHLSMLRNAGIVSDERRGQWVYYRLNDKLLPWMKKTLAVSLEALLKEEPTCSDMRRLHNARKQTPCS